MAAHAQAAARAQAHDQRLDADFNSCWLPGCWSGPGRKVLSLLVEQLNEVEKRIAQVEAEIRAWHRSNPVSQRLAKIPGIGPLTASAIAATVPDASLFCSGREFAAWLGLVPRQKSTGGTVVPGRLRHATSHPAGQHRSRFSGPQLTQCVDRFCTSTARPRTSAPDPAWSGSCAPRGRRRRLKKPDTKSRSRAEVRTPLNAPACDFSR